MAAVELHFGSLNWLCPLRWQWRAVLRDGFKCQNGLGLSGFWGCWNINSTDMWGVCVFACMCGHIHGCIYKYVHPMHQCVLNVLHYKCVRTISRLQKQNTCLSNLSTHPSTSSVLPSLFPSPPPHSLSVLCYRWQNSCLWCLAGEPGPAALACSAHGHCSLVPGGLLAPSGLPSDPQSPRFPPWWPVEDKITSRIM